MQKMRRWKKMTTTKNLKKKKDINEPFFETIFIYKKVVRYTFKRAKG